MSELGDPVMMTMSGLFLVLIFAFIKTFHKLWWSPTRIQKFMAQQGIKGPPYRLIHGNTKQILNMAKETKRPMDLSDNVFAAIQPHVHRWTKIYGKNYLQWRGSQAQLVVTEAELCREILNNKDGAYLKKKIVQNFMKLLLGNGIITTPDYEKWTKLRKLANHAFQGESLTSVIPTVIACGETMLERWKNHQGKEIEVYEEFRLLSSDVISRTAFGSSYKEEQNVFDMLKRLTFLAVKNFYTSSFPGISKLYKISDEIEAEKIEKALRSSISEIVKKREKEAMSGEEHSFGSDYLGLLLKAHHAANDKQRISVDELIDECKAFYFAGQETTTKLFTWTVLLLAIHTDWQEEARKEVLQLFGKHTPNPDDIAQLKIMSMILNESLRLYPPLTFIERKVSREVRLGKYIVPANLDLIILPLALHHDPEIWGQDVQLFKPERFSDGVAKATKNNIGAFVPFGMGSRSCAGTNFALNEAKIVLSMILQRYSFTLSPAYIHSLSPLTSVRPEHGVQVILHSLVTCP